MNGYPPSIFHEDTFIEDRVVNDENSGLVCLFLLLAGLDPSYYHTNPDYIIIRGKFSLKDTSNRLDFHGGSRTETRRSVVVIRPIS